MSTSIDQSTYKSWNRDTGVRVATQRAYTIKGQQGVQGACNMGQLEVLLRKQQAPTSPPYKHAVEKGKASLSRRKIDAE